MTCHHSKTVEERIEVSNFWTGEVEVEWVTKTVLTTVDVDVGRFKCTQCGQMFYYTGHWREFWENGTPCFGSDRLK